MKTHISPPKTTFLRQRGLSLVELMISLTIGLILLAGLSLLFVESSRSHRELSEMSKQVESGRYALQLLTDELHLAGFYGRFADIPSDTIPVPATAPDPCALGNTTALLNALPIHIQGYAAASFSARPVVSALCAAFLPAANLQPGSDVFAIRRADTYVLQPTDTPTANEVYLQASAGAIEIQLGSNASAIGTTKKANGNDATAAPAVLNKGGTAAPIRKYRVHVYFVAPCSIPAGGGTICTGPNDDGGKPIPTLKRLELTSVGGATAMNTVSLVEGIEMLKIDYGVDLTPAPNAAGTIGDGAPEFPFKRTPASLDEWSSTVAANLYVLSRNPLSGGYTDSKAYAMGEAGDYTPGGNFRRHIYSASVRLSNPGMRREIP